MPKPFELSNIIVHTGCMSMKDITESLSVHLPFPFPLLLVSKEKGSIKNARLFFSSVGKSGTCLSD